MPDIRCELIEVYPFTRRDADVAFLMLRRAEGDLLGGTWHAVQGRIEDGETAVAAALRELREESGLTPTRFWQTDHVHTFYVARGDCVHMAVCFAAEVKPAAPLRLSDEHDAWRWVASADAGQAFMWPGQRRAIEEIQREILMPGPSEPHLQIPPPPL